MINFSPSSIPKEAGIYAMYNRNGDVAYVGHSTNLRNRIVQHMVRRDSSVATGVSATVLNPEKVARICWWLKQEFSDQAYLEAAEVVAFEVLNPSLRSRGSITNRAQDIIEDGTFHDEFVCLFRGEPSGDYHPKTFDNLAELVLELHNRVTELEKQRGIQQVTAMKKE